MPFVGALLALAFSQSPPPDRPADVELDSLHRDVGPVSGTRPQLRVRVDTFPPDSAQNAAVDSALEAAEVDPGILIFPDTSVEAQIQTITPPRRVDPEMILPLSDSQDIEVDGE